jgi:hypothetical protein
MSREQGSPSRGRGAPHACGDLTAKAIASGKRSLAQPARVASPSQATGPLLNLAGRPVYGMRPPAIAARHRRESASETTIVEEVAA